MSKLLKLVCLLAVTKAGFLVMPLNLGEDLTDFKNIIGSWQVNKAFDFKFEL